MKKALVAVVVLAAAAGGAWWYVKYRQVAPKFSVTTAAVTRGDVVDTVGATGTLQAVTTVQVGTQVSGTIQALYADFNSLVRKGQVLARLDPSLFQTQIEQARANLIRAEADLERLKVSLDDAQTKLTRARELSGRQLIPKSELDTAEVNVRSAEAQIRSSDAQVTQARASLNQNEVNLEHTVIEAPIDGLVISRAVDVGQTVAASMQAPTLFVLAADLTKMQVLANLDESDVGRIRPGQHVNFRVDAYPNETFHGAVSQVRLNPIVQQNVVTYATVIDVPNNELKLKPGMTANVNVEIARTSNALRVPTSALRFRPTPEMFTAMGLPAPDPASLRDAPGRRGAAQEGPAVDGATAPLAAAPDQAAAGGREGAGPAAAAPQSPGAAAGPEGGRGGGTSRGDLAERLQAMTPEQRERMTARLRARGLAADAEPAGRGRGAGPGAATRTQPAAAAPANQGATTIDALFAPIPRTITPGRVWLHGDKQLTPVRVRTGISDGQLTEIVDGDVHEGMEVVTNITTGGETRPAATAFPFGQPGRGGPGGFQGGGANRGGAARGGGR